jgi:hypothetical protein
VNRLLSKPCASSRFFRLLSGIIVVSLLARVTSCCLGLLGLIRGHLLDERPQESSVPPVDAAGRELEVVVAILAGLDDLAGLVPPLGDMMLDQHLLSSLEGLYRSSRLVL